MKKKSQLMVLFLAVPVLILILFIGVHNYDGFGDFKTGYSQKKTIERANNQIRSILPLWKLVSKQLLPQG